MYVNGVLNKTFYKERAYGISEVVYSVYDFVGLVCCPLTILPDPSQSDHDRCCNDYQILQFFYNFDEHLSGTLFHILHGQSDS